MISLKRHLSKMAFSTVSVVICNEILMIVGSDYGTYVIHLAHRFLLQYVVSVNKIVTSAHEVIQISVKR